MAEAKMTRREQQCIAECIFKHWDDSRHSDSEEREQHYEQCLSDCSICA